MQSIPAIVLSVVAAALRMKYMHCPLSIVHSFTHSLAPLVNLALTTTVPAHLPVTHITTTGIADSDIRCYSEWRRAKITAPQNSFLRGEAPWQNGDRKHTLTPDEKQSLCDNDDDKVIELLEMTLIKNKAKDGLAFCRELTRRTLKVIAEETKNDTGEGVKAGKAKRPKGTGVATFPISIHPASFTQPGVEHIKSVRGDAVARANHAAGGGSVHSNSD